MSTIEPVCCYRCGLSISDKMEAYQYLLYLKNENKKSGINVYNEVINTETTIEMQDTYKILGIPNVLNKYCCNILLMSTVTLKDLRVF